MSGPTSIDAGFKAYIDGTSDVQDTLRQVARAYLMLAMSLAEVTSGQTEKVKDIADQMTALHDQMKALNAKISAQGAGAPGDKLIQDAVRMPDPEFSAFKTALITY